MSVDSGLLSYGQVDDSEFLKSKGLSYRDVSCTDLLVKDADLFYEWAFRCVETYRSAEPHQGYAGTYIYLRML
jgi:hypothetical protein